MVIRLDAGCIIFSPISSSLFRSLELDDDGAFRESEGVNGVTFFRLRRFRPLADVVGSLLSRFELGLSSFLLALPLAFSNVSGGSKILKKLLL